MRRESRRVSRVARSLARSMILGHGMQAIEFAELAASNVGSANRPERAALWAEVIALIRAIQIERPNG